MSKSRITAAQLDALSELLRELADEVRTADYILASLLDCAYSRAYQLAARECERAECETVQTPNLARVATH